MSYTVRGLVLVFFWMLFGDFCLSMMEQVIPNILPLTLERIGASNATIGLLVGTTPMLMNMAVTPVLGYRSDRHRGPWGRRIPYLIWPTPIIAVCLILVGLAPDLGNWFHHRFLGAGTVSPAFVVLLTIGLFTVLFQFFNMFVASVYYWLFNDVIPAQLMGRFYALFRLVGSAAGFVFNGYVLPHAESHTRQIYVSMGLIYLISFLLMCWRVKEGTYPPPDLDRRSGSLRAIMTFVRQCFTLPYYWHFYLAYGLFGVGGVGISVFRILFSKELGLSLDETGQILKWSSLISLVLCYPLGWLADKIHPPRLYVISVAIALIVALASIVGIHSKASFAAFTVLWIIAITINGAANGPLFPSILPKAKFGQFASAASLVNAGLLVLANYCIGLFIDAVGTHRAIYWWSAAFTAMSLPFSFLMYRGWLKHGGDRAYVAPLPEDS